MTNRVNRREFLTGAGVTILISAAGCAGDSPSDTPSETKENTPSDTPSEPAEDTPSDTSGADKNRWTTFRGDAARSGVRMADAGPGKSISIGWEFRGREVVAALEDIDAEDLESPTEVYPSWPVIAEGYVVLTIGYRWVGPDDGGTKLKIVGLEPVSGDVSWEHLLQEDPDIVQNWFAPEVHEDRVIAWEPPGAGEGEGESERLDAVVLDADTGDDIDHVALELSPSISQPLVADGTIYAIEPQPPDDEVPVLLHAYDLQGIDSNNPKPKWTVGTDFSLPGRPRLSYEAGTLYRFESQEPAIVALDAETGDTNWDRSLALPKQFSTQRPARLAAPVIANNRLFSAGDRRSYLYLDIAPTVALNAEDGGQEWQFEPPALEGLDHPIAQQRDLSAEEANQLRPYFATYGQPAVTEDRLLVTGRGNPPGGGSEEHNYLFAVDANDGSLTWSKPIDLPSVAPVVAGDIVYVLTGTSIEAISTDGNHLDTAKFGEGGLSSLSPALGGGRLFAPVTDGLIMIE